MRRERLATPPLPRPGWQAASKVATERPPQPALITGTGAGNSQQPSSCGPIYFTVRVNVILTASRTVDDDQARKSLRDDSGHPRRFVHSRKCRRCGDAGMCSYVELHRRHHVGSGLGDCGPTATGRLSGHADILRSRRARPGFRDPGLALFRKKSTRYSRIYATSEVRSIRSFGQGDLT